MPGHELLYFIEQVVDIKGREQEIIGSLGEGNYEQARKYFLEARAIFEKIADQEGRGKLFCNLGQLYLARKRYPTALAFLPRARVILDEPRGSGHEGPQVYIDHLHREIGGEDFFDLLTSVEARAETLIEQALKGASTAAQP